MFDKCEICLHWKFNIKQYTVTDSPGGGRDWSICKKCYDKGLLPKSFEEKWGISGTQSGPVSVFVRYVGHATLTSSEYGQNAYGSITGEYSDGSRLPVICGHGGSAWLCLGCAKEIEAQQDAIDNMAEFFEEKEESK